MSRNDPDFRPVGWALAAAAFTRWLGLRLGYIVMALLAIWAASFTAGLLTGQWWAALAVAVAVAAFFVALVWPGRPRAY